MAIFSHYKKYILCALLSLFGIAALPLEGASVQLQEKLGVKNFGVLKDPKFVTILTMVPEGAKNRYSSIKEMHLNQEEVERLTTNLLDDHNYDFNRVKSCHFQPEISFKFHGQNDKIVHVFVSPSCNQVLFGMDTFSVLLNYDPVHERLENFLQQLVKDTRARNKDTAGRG